MKLRNKKTGEIIESACIGVFEHKSSGDCERVDTEARSLEKVLEVWEDYKPAEPLIKDEKIRKAVRAWAEACNLKYVTYRQASNEFYDANTRGAFAIRFTLMPVEVYLEDGEHYTIDELCGTPEPLEPTLIDLDERIKEREEEC